MLQKLSSAFIIITFIQAQRLTERRRKDGAKRQVQVSSRFLAKAEQHSHFTQHLNSIRLCVCSTQEEKEENNACSAFQSISCLINTEYLNFVGTNNTHTQKNEKIAREIVVEVLTVYFVIK